MNCNAAAENLLFNFLDYSGKPKKVMKVARLESFRVFGASDETREKLMAAFGRLNRTDSKNQGQTSIDCGR